MTSDVINRPIDKSLTFQDSESVISSDVVRYSILIESSFPASLLSEFVQLPFDNNLPQLNLIFDIDSQSVNPEQIPSQDIIATVEEILDPANTPDELIISSIIELEDEISKNVFSLNRKKVTVKIESRRKLEPIREDEDFRFFISEEDDT